MSDGGRRSTQDGALVNQWECSNQANQMWSTGTPPPACPSYRVSATLSDVLPPIDGAVIVSGVITCNGQGIAGVAMKVTFEYGTVTTECAGTTITNGTAVCGQAVHSAASAGQLVKVRVCFDIAELRSCLETGFTPQ